MTYYRNSVSSISFCVLLMLVVAIVDVVRVNGDRLDKCSTEYRCAGPVKHYEALRCTPVYMKDDDCCPWRYNCDHLHDVVYKNRCLLYYSRHVYQIGEEIKEEDANICEKNCICTSKWKDYADFNCTSRKELCPPHRHSRRGCYKGQFIQCCPEVEVCQLEKPGGCTRNGKTYLPGDFIVPEDDPNTLCRCEETKFKNAPIDKNRYTFIPSDMSSYMFECTKANMYTYTFKCLEFNDWFDENPELAFHKNCAPVYLPNEFSRQTWRCQNDKDFIIDENSPHLNKSKATRAPLWAVHCPTPEQIEYEDSNVFNDGACLLINPEGHPDVEIGLEYRNLCRFGQILMNIGDQLNGTPYGNDYCIVCFCNIPPVPTCLLLSKTHCEVQS